MLNKTQKVLIFWVQWPIPVKALRVSVTLESSFTIVRGALSLTTDFLRFCQVTVIFYILWIIFSGCRLHDAVHEPRHHHLVHKTGQTGSKPLLVPVPLVARRLDLHGDGLLGRFAPPLHACQSVTL